jgi:hypothetical protein
MLLICTLLLVNLPCKLFMWFRVCCNANHDAAIEIVLDFDTPINLHKARVCHEKWESTTCYVGCILQTEACFPLAFQLPLLICKSFMSHIVSI